MRDLYKDLLDVVEPHLSDFTGYDEKEGAFNIVLAVKELLEERSDLLKELQSYGATGICETCTERANMEADKLEKELIVLRETNEIINFIASVRRFPPIQIWKSIHDNRYHVECSPSFEDVVGSGVTLHEALIHLISELECYLNEEEINDLHRLH